MKAVRQLIGFVWIAVFIWGVVSLIRGEWASLAIAVVSWFILGLIFSSAHTALERTEVQSLGHLFELVGAAVRAGDWPAALSASQKALKIAHGGANRDRSILGPGGNGANMLPALGMAMLNHGAILGANGQTQEGREMLHRGTVILNQGSGMDPDVQQCIRVASELQAPHTGIAEFRQAARAINAAV